jgi:hypothetical protein
VSETLATSTSRVLAQALRAVRYSSKTRKCRLAIGSAPTSSEYFGAWSDSDHVGWLASHQSVARYIVSLLGFDGEGVIGTRKPPSSHFAHKRNLAAYYSTSTQHIHVS